MVKSLDPSTSLGISEQDVLFAKESIPFLQACVQTPGSRIYLEINGKNLILPEALKLVLSRSVELIAEQRAVTVLSAEEEIGTQEAADMLNVSRPHLVKLLDSGVIDSRKVGVQRRVSVGDVVAYRDTQKAARRRALIELAAEGQRLNLGE
jgi:excisionase family DNA binding protein